MILCSVLLLFQEVLYSQAFLSRDTTGIKTKIEQTGKYKSSFQYNKLGCLTEINYGTVNYKYKYNISDTLIIVTEHLINKISGDTTEYLHKIYFDSLNRICTVKINMYGNFSSYDDHYIYKDNEKRLTKIIRRNYFKNRSVVALDTTFFEYFNRANVYLATTYFNFDGQMFHDKEGNPFSYNIRKSMYSQVEYLNYRIDLLMKENGYFEYNEYSKYDKKGNWRKRFRIDFTGKRQTTIRKIVYW